MIDCMNEREKELRQELGRILDILIRGYNPAKVILFGSLASGNVGESSDIDLAIIKITDDRFLDRISNVMMLIRPKFACDIVVYTPQEFEQMSRDSNYFIHDEIKMRGKVLYECGQ